MATTPEPAALYGHMVSPLSSTHMVASCDTFLDDSCCTQKSTLVEESVEVRRPTGRVLMLSDMIDPTIKVDAECTNPGLAHLPSVGSALHGTGNCKPCGFFHKNGCKAGVECTFCHLCDSGEKKRRQREKREMFRNAERLASCPSRQ